MTRDPLQIWRNKLAFLQQQEAITADPALKFQLQQQIIETRAKIAELETPDNRVALPLSLNWRYPVVLGCIIIASIALAAVFLWPGHDNDAHLLRQLYSQDPRELSEALTGLQNTLTSENRQRDLFAKLKPILASLPSPTVPTQSMTATEQCDFQMQHIRMFMPFLDGFDQTYREQLYKIILQNTGLKYGRLVALEALGDLKDNWRDAIMDRDPDYAEAAAYFIGKHQGPFVQELLRETLNKGAEPKVMVSLITTLGRLECKAATPEIKPLLKNPEKAVRKAAAGALGMIATPEALDALKVAAQKESDPDVRASLATTIEVIQVRRTVGLPRGLPAAGVNVRQPSEPAAFNDCPPEGNGGDAFLNRLKNRTDVADRWIPLGLPQVIALPYPESVTRTLRKDWPVSADEMVAPYEGFPISVEGYLIGARLQGPESCNCGRKETEMRDIMDRLSSDGQDRAASLVVEFTPSLRNKHPSWTLQKLRQLKDRGELVRLSGWLLLDNQHLEQVGRTRGTPWEIHPVMEIEVKQGERWVKLDALPL